MRTDHRVYQTPPVTDDVDVPTFTVTALGEVLLKKKGMPVETENYSRFDPGTPDGEMLERIYGMQGALDASPWAGRFRVYAVKKKGIYLVTEFVHSKVRPEDYRLVNQVATSIGAKIEVMDEYDELESSSHVSEVNTCRYGPDHGIPMRHVELSLRVPATKPYDFLKRWVSPFVEATDPIWRQMGNSVC